MTQSEAIIVLDFGSQYTQLIARRIRELGVYSEIKPFYIDIEELRALTPQGIILSGGPSSVYADDAPIPDAAIFDLGCPVLGICYGLQVIAHLLDGKVDKAQRREYGLDESRRSSHRHSARIRRHGAHHQRADRRDQK